MNLANKLTIFRIILVPIMLIIGVIDRLVGIPGSLLGITSAFWIMEIIFIVASITDKLDGYIARSRNQITTFGKFLDPIADKILVLTAMIILVEYTKIPAWIPVIVMFREFLVSGYRLLACEKGGKVIAASFWGKLKTVTQMCAIILVFVDKYNFFDFVRATTSKSEALVTSLKIYMETGNIVLNAISSILLLVCVIATIFSGYDYLKNGKKQVY